MILCTSYTCSFLCLYLIDILRAYEIEISDFKLLKIVLKFQNFKFFIKKHSNNEILNYKNSNFA